MKLIDDWKKVLRHAESVRWMVAAALFSGLEVALPILGGIPFIPNWGYAFVSAFCVGMAFVTRLKAQKEFDE